MDRNFDAVQIVIIVMQSLSARRAWIEILCCVGFCLGAKVALRKESVDRNTNRMDSSRAANVALRKESVDRNFNAFGVRYRHIRSLSARRAWIEIPVSISDSALVRRRSPQGERG